MSRSPDTVDSIRLLAEPFACHLHKPLKSYTDVRKWSGRNEMKVIGHQYKTVDAKVMKDCGHVQFFTKYHPHFFKWDVKPITINTSRGNVIWKVRLLNCFWSRHSRIECKVAAELANE